MKKTVKIVLWALAGLATIGGTIYYLNMPADIETVTVNPETAFEYFIEEGNVVGASAINVYSALPGIIVQRMAQEGDVISEGDIICVLDVTEIEHAIARTRAAIEGHKAQKDNVDEQQEARVSELNSILVGLRGELRNVTAQEADYLARVEDETHQANEAIQRANNAISSSNEQIKSQTRHLARMQQIAIDHAQSVYDQAKAAADAVPHPGDPDLNKSRDTAWLALEKARAELTAINQGDDHLEEHSALLDVKTYTESFASLKQTLREKIAVVEKQIEEDNSESMRRYYDSVIAGEETQIKLLEKNIEDSTIRSPVSGRIVELYIKDSNIVNTAAPIALVETERLQDIEVFVTTKDYTDIYIGQAVEITQPASGGDIVFGGVVKDIAGEAEMRLSTLGIAERVVKVTVEPEEHEQAALLPGFSFDVRFITYSEDNKLLVPKTAVFKYSANKAAGGIIWLDTDLTGRSVIDVDMVFDTTNGKAVMREVRLGRELRSDYVIEAGLSAGSVVIKDSSDESIRVGMNVR